MRLVLGLKGLRQRQATSAPAPSAGPTLAWTSANNVYDPTFSITGVTFAVGDVVELQIDDDPAFASLYDSDSNTLDATEAGSGDVSFPGISTLTGDTTWNARVRVNGGAWSNTASLYLLDNVAPTLSLPTFTSVTETTATIGVTTNEAAGTLRYVVTTSATQPSVAQIRAAQDHTGAAAFKSGSAASPGTGTETFALTGLTGSTTYYAYFLHDDAVPNPSNIASTSFLTSAPAGGIGVTQHTAPPGDEIGFGSSTATFSATLDAGLGIILVSSYRNVSGVTVDAVAATLVAVSAVSLRQASIWRINVASGGTKSIVVTGAAGHQAVAIDTLTLTGATATPTATAAVAYNYGAGPHTSGSLTVPTGGVAIGMFHSETASATVNITAGTAGETITTTNSRSVSAFRTTTGEIAQTGTGGWAGAFAVWGP